MEYTILGNTRNTKNLEVAWVDTDDEFAYNDLCNETIWEIAEELFSLGIDVITSGNHIWDKQETIKFIEEESIGLLNVSSTC